MNAERLLALYEQIADAPDAIARLRRFILDLAVRGKLVPQSSGDETASKFLERITNSDQVTKGKESGKAHKATTGLVDPPFDLPATWTWSAFGEVHQLIRGVTYSKSDVSEGPRAGYVPVLRANNIGASLTHDEPVYVKRSCVSEDQFLKAGDFMIALSSGSKNLVGKAAFVPEDYHEAFGGFCGVIRLFDCSLQGLVRIFLQSGLYRQSISAESRGIGINNLKKEALSKLFFPLPPLAEQDRIVAKVDELMALCDQLEKSRTAREETRDRLTAASLARLNDPAPETFQTDARFALDALSFMTARTDQIKQLRQTIFNLAVLGKLVPQDEDHQAAATSLNRLRQAQMTASASEGLRTRQPVEKLSRDDMWFKFPESWALSHFDDLFVIVSGVTKGQKVAANAAADAPYLRVANVQRGHLDLTIIKTITVRQVDRERYALKRGDILMTEGGDWNKLGRAAIWRDEISGCIHQNHIFRVRPPSPDILPEWVITYVNSPLGRAFFEDASKQTTNLASINMTQLRGCPIPLPSLTEQKRIVVKVNELMALCDRLEASLAAGSIARSRLLDALLSEAIAPIDAPRLEAAE